MWFKIPKSNLLIFAAGSLLLAVFGFYSRQGVSPPETKIIKISSEGFDPANLEIRVGQKIKFVNQDTMAHWPASDPHPIHNFLKEFDPTQELKPGKSWQLTFVKVGKWTYHDHLFPHRRGEIIVVGKEEPKAKGLPEEIVRLQKEIDPKKQAQIVKGMAEKYGPKAALEFMKLAGLPYTGETHLLVHEIGNVAYARYGKEALLYCDESFLSACFHGVVINTLGGKGFQGVAAMVVACKAADPHVLGQCSHAAGHGFLAFESYQVLEALPFCDRLHEFDSAIPTFNCNDGVFMENIFGVHEGKPSPNRMVRADDPYYPCNAVPEQYQPGCWANQATLMYQMFGGDLRRVAQGCDGVKNSEHQRTCYHNFARQIHPLTLGKTGKALALCKNATGLNWQDQCLITLVEAAFSVGDKTQLPQELCAAMEGSAKQEACYQSLFANIASYAKTSQDLAEMCSFVREEKRQQECGRRFRISVTPNPAILGISLEEIRKVAQTSGAKVAYELVKERYLNDPVKAHDLAHLTGLLAYEEQGASGFAVCDNNFAFGCYHGLFEALIRKEGDKGINLARQACHSLSPGGRVVSCLHGIGHGIMGFQGQLDKALAECEAFPFNEQIYCFDGSYMEYYAGVMEERAKGLNISLDKPWEFCLGKLGASQSQCVRNHTLFLLYQGPDTRKAVIESCDQLASSLKSFCVESVGLFAAQTASGKPQVAQEICGGFLSHSDDQAVCQIASAGEFVFQGRGISLSQEVCRGLSAVWFASCQAEINETAALYGLTN